MGSIIPLLTEFENAVKQTEELLNDEQRKKYKDMLNRHRPQDRPLAPLEVKEPGARDRFQVQARAEAWPSPACRTRACRSQTPTRASR